MEDAYYTISAPAQGQYSQLRSKFIGLARPVSSEEEALGYVEQVRREYYDARHVCWAYRLGLGGERYRSNDDGEPSGTAGKPILGAMVSAGLSDLVVVVVRYFGGVKLGTSGLIEAYRSAAHEALEVAERKEVILERRMQVEFGYDLMGEVMRLIKDWGARVLVQDFREACRLELSLRAGQAGELFDRFDQLHTVTPSWMDGGEPSADETQSDEEA